jgi:Zn-dependent protease with chaperone function
MNPSYIGRLLCLSLACFFLVNLALGAIVAWSASRAVRLADRMKPRTAARFLLTLRLFPGLGAVLAVAGICVPSYLWLEPRGASEDVGAAFLAVGLLGAMVCGISMARAANALVISRRYIRDCERAGEKVVIAGEPAWVVKDGGRIIALAGMFRPQVLISHDAITALEAEQIKSVLRHERGHGVSHDNLKRLALTLAPDALPFVRWGFSTIEHAWAKFAEWAADDYAAMGDPALSVSLASALVRVARIPAGAPTPAFLTPFMDGDFSTRVERLLADPVPVEQGVWPQFSRGAYRALWVGIGVTAAVAFLLLLRPATLLSAHMLLERLIK